MAKRKPVAVAQPRSVEMWRAIVHSYFMSGLTNRDGIAALCAAALDELTWIDQNFQEGAQ